MLPEHFVRATELAPEDPLVMASAVQAYTDGAVALSLQLPHSATVHEVDLALLRAWELNLKACQIGRERRTNGRAA